MNCIELAKQRKQRSRGWSDDMDSQAIARQLAIVDELYAAWLQLKTAKPLGCPVSELKHSGESKETAIRSE